MSTSSSILLKSMLIDVCNTVKSMQINLFVFYGSIKLIIVLVYFITAFENARGYKIERDVYKNDLLGRSYYAEPEEQPHYWNPPSRSRDRRSYYSSHNRNSRNNNSRYSRRDAYHY